MARMRTIKEAAVLLKEADCGTAVAESSIRRLVNDRRVPYITIGRRILVNYDALLIVLAGDKTSSDAS